MMAAFAALSLRSFDRVLEAAVSSAAMAIDGDTIMSPASGEAALRAAGAVHLLPSVNSLAESLPGLLGALIADPGQLQYMSQRAAALVDGAGVSRVLDAMEALA